MNKEKNFVQLLIRYAIVLLLPVIVIEMVMVFFVLGKLEKQFKGLNTKTIEAANVRMDMLMEEVLAVSYQLSINEDVYSFLIKEFGSNVERISLLKDIRESITASLVNKDGVSNVVLYSKINDVFIGNTSVFNRLEYYERFFAQSEYEYEKLFETFESVRSIPIWMATDEYLVYCSDARVSGHSDKGKFFAMVKKQKVLDTLSEVFGNLEMECVILYRGKEILIKTEGFGNVDYEMLEMSGNNEYRDQNSLVKKYSSQKAGGLEYVYMINYEDFGGNITRMMKNLILIIVIVIVISAGLAGRKINYIRDMYVEILREKVSLEKDLNNQVEKLNQQLIFNALRGYNILPQDTQHIYLKSSKQRVLIFRFAGSNDFVVDETECKDIRGITKNCLEEEAIECLFLCENSVGYICILGYEQQEKLERGVSKLKKMFEQHYSLGIYMGLSTEISNIANLSDAYERAEAAAQYCGIFCEEGGLIEYADVIELENGKIYYPYEKEKHLLRSIRMGMREETEKCFERIYEMNFREKRLPKGALRQLLVKLLNTIYELIDVVYSGDVAKSDDFGRVSRNVLQADDMEYAFEIIRNIALSICDKCSVRKEGELRKQIINYISENFKNQNLSLEKMASDFEMSYYHLSRLFNEYMQMNFAAYLTGVRLAFSKELLESTGLSVEEVARQSGFLQSGSFIRAFKKFYGVTPGKYREEIKKSKI